MRWLAVLAVLLGLVAWAADVQASCVTQTIYGPNGQASVCTTCCVGSFCNTTCT